MSSTARLTLLVMGAVAVTLILAAAVSAAMDGGNSLRSLGHRVAIRATAGDAAPASASQGPDVVAATPEPPAADAPDPEATIYDRHDEPERQEAGDRHRDGDGGDGHGDGHGR